VANTALKEIEPAAIDSERGEGGEGGGGRAEDGRVVKQTN